MRRKDELEMYLKGAQAVLVGAFQVERDKGREKGWEGRN